MASYRGTQEPTARQVGSGDPCDGAALLQGIDASGWVCALWQFIEAPGGYLPGQWSMGVCTLDRCNYIDYRSAAEEWEVRVFA